MTWINVKHEKNAKIDVTDMEIYLNYKNIEIGVLTEKAVKAVTFLKNRCLNSEWNLESF